MIDGGFEGTAEPGSADGDRGEGVGALEESNERDDGGGWTRNVKEAKRCAATPPRLRVIGRGEPSKETRRPSELTVASRADMSSQVRRQNRKLSLCTPVLPQTKHRRDRGRGSEGCIGDDMWKGADREVEYVYSGAEDGCAGAG